MRSTKGSPAAIPMPPPITTASTSSTLTAERDAGARAPRPRWSMSWVAPWVVRLQRPRPDAAREPVAAALLHDLEQARSCSPLSCELARAALHRDPAGVGLHAARGGRTGSGGRRSRTTTWPISPAAARPSHGLPSSTMPAADAGAPEHAEDRAVRLARAERELRVGRDLDVVAQPHLRAERVREHVAEGVGVEPVGQVAGGRDGPARCRPPRRESPRRRRRGRSWTAPASSAASANGVGHRGRHIGWAARGGGRRTRRAEHRSAVADDDRLDLGAAEVDAATNAHALSMRAIDDNRSGRWLLAIERARQVVAT